MSSARKNQTRNRRKHRNVENEDDFMEDGAAGPGGRRSREPRQRQSGKPGKRAKQEKRRTRRREETEFNGEESFDSFPWEDLFQSDLGIHLAEILAGYARLKSRIGNNISWIAVSYVLHELLRYINTYMFGDSSVWITVLSSVSLGLALLWLNRNWPTRLQYIIPKLVVLSCVLLGGIATFLSLWAHLFGAVTPLLLGRFVVATFGLQLLASVVIARSSFESVDLASLLLVCVVGVLGYPATVLYGTDHNGSSTTLSALVLLLGFSLGGAKVLCAKLSLPGSYHRVTLGNSVLTLWGVVLLVVLCRESHGCVIFHMVCRYVTLVFLEPSDGRSYDRSFKLTGEPRYDFLHMLAEVLIHAIAAGVFRVPVGAVLLMGLCWLAYRWNFLRALQRLSLRVLIACLVLTLALRLLSYLVHGTLSYFPIWLTCCAEPFILVFLCSRPKLVSILSWYSAPPDRLA